jgi:hypothetical protein
LWPALRASRTVMAIRSGTVTRAALESSTPMFLTLRRNEKGGNGAALLISRRVGTADCCREGAGELWRSWAAPGNRGSVDCRERMLQ